MGELAVKVVKVLVSSVAKIRVCSPQEQVYPGSLQYNNRLLLYIVWCDKQPGVILQTPVYGFMAT